MRCLLACVVVLALAQPRHAAAEDHGDIDPGTVYVLGGLYLGGTAAFAIKDIAGSKPGMNYGIGEVLWNGTFTVLWTRFIISDALDGLSSHSGLPAASIFGGANAALLAHGIYTIVRNARHKTDAPPRNQGPPGAMQLGPVTAVVAPAAMQDGAGLGLAGTF
ncbi:MAG TPA: hypothetical protein VFV99_06930 [Kofleriaceae bacterium]|nr:hypothetical protein [Kofleriaceae bacterium]